MAENAKDLAQGEQQGIPASTLDRIMLNEERIAAMADAIHLLVSLNDPVGTIVEHIEKDNGLRIEKRIVPLGVIGMIYEARPNVTIDAATLSLKRAMQLFCAEAPPLSFLIWLLSQVFIARLLKLLSLPMLFN